jgi:molybdopterin-containing oxidoreductase family iron-sulfur binding subunit
VDSKGLDARWVTEVAKDLFEHREEALLVAGPNQPAAVHAVTHLLNHALGAVGRTVDYAPAFLDATTDGRSLAALVALLKKDKTQALLVLGGNPVFHAPPSLGLADALERVAQKVHLSDDFNETSEKCRLHVNRAHFLESWGDVRSADGTASIVQPLIAPLFDGKTPAELIDVVLGKPRPAYERVRETWAALRGADFERDWPQALHAGLFADTMAAPEPVAVQAAAAAAAAVAAWKVEPAAAGTFEVDFQPDFHAWDGSTANNGWLQELPDPITKVTWDNVARLAPSDATKLGVVTGDLLELGSGRAGVRIAALVSPGQAPGSVHVCFGQGRQVIGKVGAACGVDAYPLRPAQGPGFLRGVTVAAAGGTKLVAQTQEHHSMEGRPLVREGTLEELKKKPDFAGEMSEVPNLESIYGEHQYLAQRWGMVIDLSKCIGCNACMVGCQAENNIPVVGRDGVANSREMHWIRVDRYYEGKDPDHPTAVVMQPVTCQQCEAAPCEAVCPVAATTHSPEGLNDMAYNRCIGTRYCANNCPYKVRRFNFLHYQADVPELHKMQFNPDVTVRGRGVMEKCTFCVQRINQAKIEAHKDGKSSVADGRIQTACQQGCPTQAITFGDLNDPKSKVAALASDARGYRMLEELNIRPRVTYLARIRNPNPSLERA